MAVFDLKKWVGIGTVRMLFAAAAVVATSSAAISQTRSFAFGLWGDMPYAKANDGPKMPALLKSINGSDIAFSIYDGDIKDGSSKCTDNVYTDALDMFGKLKRPVIYIPGDNEWTDCHRVDNGSYNNQERLAHLRKVMFPTSKSLGQTKLALEHQGKPGEKYVENTRFTYGGIVFVGLNIPGSNNNKVLDEKDCKKKSSRTPADCAADNVEYQERDAANVTWMQAAFKRARQQKSPGIVLVWQADPGFDLPETEDLDESKAPEVSGYQSFLKNLVAETENFSGQVLVVHGDQHFFRVDKPLYSPTKLLANLTRIETFGSPAIHWVRVTVDPKSQQVFTVHPMIVKGN